MRTINDYGIEFYVKSYDAFNKKYPLGTPARNQIEKTITADYIQQKGRHCSLERWWRSFDPDRTTPECDKRQSLGIHI